VPSSSRPPSAIPPYSPKPYKALGQWYQPLPDARGFKQSGIASWYGDDFHGKKTSSGEIYDMYAESAAHKTLPLGTIVRVRNTDNNKEMENRINDRGPFVTGRIIDLSYACASKLGVLGPGTAPVELVAVGTTASAANSGAGSADFYYQGNFTIQVGAFSDRSNAEKLKAKLDKSYQNAHIQSYNSGREIFYRVRVTKCSSLEQAIQYEKTLASGGYDGAFAVAE
jgi:rare lipoprotein A